VSDIDIYRRQNLGNRIGFGASGALIIVDFVNGFNDADVLGGGNISGAIRHTAELLDAARSAEIPLAYTRIVYEPHGSNVGGFVAKLPSLKALTEDNPLSQVVSALKPRDGEHIVRKTQASAFFGTDLCGWLLWRKVDTVLITGCTTSGCVRASVVDAASYNFRPIVVHECVGDRALGPHEANLFDMDQKYADVVSKQEALTWIRSLASKSDR
jgi:maleamate amidohydrolase